LLKYAYFVEGNALELSTVLTSIKQKNEETKSQFFSIVLSSVIHEIYSYCPYGAPLIYGEDIATMTSVISSQYNPETVYKIYYEALKSISEHQAGGSLNIRDGVMYKNPEELVSFTLNNDSWIAMFKAFLNDVKYSHLKKNIDLDSIIIGLTITLKAKYVQEFMLKANWGPGSFGNEINEVYCYMTLEDHIKLIHRAAKQLNININIPLAKEYTQEGYREHINQNKMTILSGFKANDPQFPPTNMVIRVLLDSSGDSHSKPKASK
jgi:hypothetical protein